MSFDNWLDIPEPWPEAPRRGHRRANKRSRIQPLYQRIQKVRGLQDDRAATYNHYSCSTCNNDNSCCKCPDPRPEIPVPDMYVIDTREHTIRRLTYHETVRTLGQINHDAWMETYIGSSAWKGLVVDFTAWRPGPPDPLHVNYQRPRRFVDDDEF